MLSEGTQPGDEVGRSDRRAEGCGRLDDQEQRGSGEERTRRGLAEAPGDDERDHERAEPRHAGADEVEQAASGYLGQPSVRPLARRRTGRS